ncbi:SDR family NAD(P)-dependent oxidoreductase [Roseomonas sp. E05]|uniref:SDR family NAD(P)-dependent oxidoreductase n=1 Tax=Roseomonas sp. E05 TaxID=3046310 RepID=UPI0024BAACCB|nr:SDR family NAD(P)-dependent oxidoreductase [Roseomonas sp. E05]MDJ0389980.1 SDR family NAD(P)-dependent oxidoreductase [Roseomonas sp. E05]
MNLPSSSLEAPAILSRRVVLVTGGAGFIGSNLADRLAADGHDVLVFDALARPGVEANLHWLKTRHPERITARIADIREEAAVAEAAQDAKVAFHLAGQVAVTTSLTDPRDDFDVNLRGTFNLLDALRRQGRAVPLVFASTNKVYGALSDVTLERGEEGYRPVDAALRSHGISEARPLDFHTPYGCSKGGADQYVLDFARSFGIPTAVLRMSCIYGQRQMGTEDQGWVAHFLIRALRGEPITIFGDGYQVRDVLQVGDAVAAYLAAWKRIGAVAGRAFNLGGGPGNAVSLRQVLAVIEELVGHRIAVEYADWRAGDQRYYVSDTRLVQRELELRAPMPWRAGLAELARWLGEAQALRKSAGVAEAAR